MTGRQAFLSVLMLLGVSSLCAQNSKGNRYVVDRFTLATEGAGISNPASVTRVHIRAARDFSKRFSATTPGWRQVNDTTVARFVADSSTTFVGYGKTGKWLYTVRSFGEWLIPARIRHEIKSQYYDDRIEMAYELVFPGNPDKAYLFYMRDMSGNGKVLRWSEDGLRVVKSFKQQPDAETLFEKPLNKR